MASSRSVRRRRRWPKASGPFLTGSRRLVDNLRSGMWHLRSRRSALAAREDPNSIDALTGIAICYDQMGRYDLSRRNYETALALAPADVSLLGAFAASLQLQGLTAEALSVRQEIAARTAASAGSGTAEACGNCSRTRCDDTAEVRRGAVRRVSRRCRWLRLSRKPLQRHCRPSRLFGRPNRRRSRWRPLPPRPLALPRPRRLRRNQRHRSPRE